MARAPKKTTNTAAVKVAHDTTKDTAPETAGGFEGDNVSAVVAEITGADADETNATGSDVQSDAKPEDQPSVDEAPANDLQGETSPTDTDGATSENGVSDDTADVPVEESRQALARALKAITGDPSTVVLTATGMAVKVTGPKKGRRRAGRNFGREPVLIPIDELSEEEVAALDADPALTVTVVPVEKVSSGRG
jgi:hypothetical protein